jgi:hypothetical protein
MATKDINDRQVCEAFAERKRTQRFASDILMEITGQPEKVVNAAMERAYKRGLVECGVSMRSGWLTEKGSALLVT